MTDLQILYFAPVLSVDMPPEWAVKVTDIKDTTVVLRFTNGKVVFDILLTLKTEGKLKTHVLSASYITYAIPWPDCRKIQIYSGDKSIFWNQEAQITHALVLEVTGDGYIIHAK